MHAAADHAVSVAHAAEFRDGSMTMRFMLENEKDVLSLVIADPECIEVHSGHLVKVDVSSKQVVVDDKKTSQMNIKFFHAIFIDGVPFAGTNLDILGIGKSNPSAIFLLSI